MSTHLNLLRWKCRRGMREMDILLSRYLDEYYAEAEIAEKEAFAALLDWQDPELYALLLEATHSDPRIHAIVQKIHSQPSH